jgi:diguanylate cyclase (GGDEF)-like protein
MTQAIKIQWIGLTEPPSLPVPYSPHRAGDGYLFTFVRPDAPDSDAADLRVLVLSSLADQEPLQQQDLNGKPPTLLLSHDAASDLIAHSMARVHDDVGHEGEPLEILASRLVRLLQRSMALRDQMNDLLTGLRNRRYFDVAARARLESMLPEEHWGLLMVDVDHFKQINDQYGHADGDMVLQAVSERLRKALNPSDLLARYGGEEFVAMIRRPSPEGVDQAAEHVLQAISSQPIQCGPGTDIHVTASAGQRRLSRGVTLDDALNDVDQALYAAKAGGRNCCVSYEQMSASADAQDTDVELLHFQNVSRVVTERTNNLVMLFGRRLVQKAKQIGNMDRLTQIWNRGYFDRRIAREIELSRKDGRHLSIALMDLDHFGQFNRNHGLPTGDAVLRRFAEIATSCIRPSDWFARYGGEEFVLVVPGTANDAALVAERIRRTLEATPVPSPNRQDVFVTVSIGVVTLATEMEDAVALVQRGSEALSMAKQAGRNNLKIR